MRHKIFLGYSTIAHFFCLDDVDNDDDDEENQVVNEGMREIKAE